MIVLGIASEHCSSACLMIDGRIVGMIQEERLSKRKNQTAFPLQSIRRLAAQHLEGKNRSIDRVVFGGRESDPFYAVLDRFTGFSVADHVREQHELWYPYFYGEKRMPSEYWTAQLREGRHLNPAPNYDFSWLAQTPYDVAMRHFCEIERPAAVRRHLGFEGQVETVDHHTCHAYYALYGAPLTREQRSRSLVLTADAWGDGNNWSASVPDERGQLTRLAAGPEHGVARLYKWTTLILGMKPNEEEYKVMGLSGYSRSRQHIEAAERVFFEAFDFRDGKFTSDRPLVDSYFDLKNRLEGHRFDNIATALQNWASTLTCAWAKHWLRQTERRGLCFSGGLSMNIKINGDLLNLPNLDWLSVPASGGDESICAGACFALAADAGAVEPMAHAYLGERPQSERDHWSVCLANLNAAKTDYALREGVDAAMAARLLAADCVMARCVDAAEFGARALGNRSILANPANPANLKYINDAIKNRDFWMPFTPSILSEHANELLDNPKNVVSPYMTIGFATAPERRAAIAAAIHPGDFSARPQFVQRATNRGYWELIDEFRKITGIPALLNTSLNLHGEPMNYTLDDAIRTLHLSDLDFLLMSGDRLLYKRRAEARLDAALGYPSGKAANRDAGLARRYASQS